MADGIRIRHVSARNAIVVIRDLARPIPNKHNAPYPTCSICHVGHDHKTYHIAVEDNGTALVSTGVWENLQALIDQGGFTVVGHDPNPPAQGIDFNARSNGHRPLWVPQDATLAPFTTGGN